MLELILSGKFLPKIGIWSVLFVLKVRELIYNLSPVMDIKLPPSPEEIEYRGVLNRRNQSRPWSWICGNRTSKPLKKLPQAAIVFDLFHVVAAFNRVIAKIRNSKYHKAAKENKDVFKGSKYLLLKIYQSPYKTAVPAT